MKDPIVSKEDAQVIQDEADAQVRLDEADAQVRLEQANALAQEPAREGAVDVAPLDDADVRLTTLTIPVIKENMHAAARMRGRNLHFYPCPATDILFDVQPGTGKVTILGRDIQAAPDAAAFVRSKLNEAGLY